MRGVERIPSPYPLPEGEGKICFYYFIGSFAKRSCLSGYEGIRRNNADVIADDQKREQCQ
jgi:hypothetical protein